MTSLTGLQTRAGMYSSRTPVSFLSGSRSLGSLTVPMHVNDNDAEIAIRQIERVGDGPVNAVDHHLPDRLTHRSCRDRPVARTGPVAVGDKRDKPKTGNRVEPVSRLKTEQVSCASLN